MEARPASRSATTSRSSRRTSRSSRRPRGPAAAWRARWDSLRLFTPARYSSLPGLPFPGDPDRYPSRDEVVAYLTDYARELELPVEYDSRVVAVRARAGGGYLVELADRDVRGRPGRRRDGPVPGARACRRSHPASARGRPAAQRATTASPAGLPAGSGARGRRRQQRLPDRRRSWPRTREVHLASARARRRCPSASSAATCSGTSRPPGLMGKHRRHADRPADEGPRHADRIDPARAAAPARRRAARRGRSRRPGGRSRSTTDRPSTPATVIWATGFRSDHSWIDAPVFDDDGRLVHERGVTASPGLYFLGLPWQHTRGSALLGWVKDDAEYIAEPHRRAPRANRRASPRRRDHRPDRQEIPMDPATHFPTDTAGLAACVRSEVVDLADGDSFDLRIAPVAKRIGDATVRMLAYNGSIPGPTLRVPQGSEIMVNVANEGDLEATVHWHGLRLDNRYDGTHETQEPIPVGGTLSAPRRVPRPGRLLVPPAHARGLRARRSASTATSSSCPTTRTTGRRPPRDRADPRRHPDRGRPGRAVQPSRRRPTRRWAGSATSCSSPARPTWRCTRTARRGRPPLPDQHREHPRVQGRAARRADEARRRRQRPLRARGVRRRRDAGAVGARRRRGPVRGAGRARRSSTARPTAPTRWRSIRVARRRRRRRSTRPVRDPAPRPGADGRARAARRSTWRPRPTRRSRSSPRWTWADPRRDDASSARCTRRS